MDVQSKCKYNKNATCVDPGLIGGCKECTSNPNFYSSVTIQIISVAYYASPKIYIPESMKGGMDNG